MVECDTVDGVDIDAGALAMTTMMMRTIMLIWKLCWKPIRNLSR